MLSPRAAYRGPLRRAAAQPPARMRTQPADGSEQQKENSPAAHALKLSSNRVYRQKLTEVSARMRRSAYDKSVRFSRRRRPLKLTCGMPSGTLLGMREITTS